MTENCQGRVESIYNVFFSQCHEKPKTYFYNNLKWQGNRSLSFVFASSPVILLVDSVVVFSHLWSLQMLFPLCIYGVTLWWFRRSTCLEILSFAAMDRSLWPYAAADRQSVRQFCQMVGGVSNTNARIEDRSDWLIQQLQPEPLHPWQKTEPTSFLFQIYNLEAWEPLQEKMWKLMQEKMCYDRDHFNNHANPEKVVQIRGGKKVRCGGGLYLSTPLNGAGCTCVKLFGGEAKRQPLLTSSESTSGASYENFLRERLGETGRKTWYSQNMVFHCLSNVYRHNQNHGICLQTDAGYDSCDPIIGFSFGTGSSLVIACNYALKMRKKAVSVYQPINSATVMAGDFQKEYQHGVPSFNDWYDILEKNSWEGNGINEIKWADGHKGELQDEFNRLSKLSATELGGKSNWRFNCTLRWHRNHKPDCPAGKRTASNVKQGCTLGDVPTPYLSSMKPRLTEQDSCYDPMKTQVFCSLRDAYAVDLNTERLKLLRFGGCFQLRDNIRQHLDDVTSGTKTNKNNVAKMETDGLLLSSDAMKLLSDLGELEALRLKRRVLQEFTSTVITSENSFFTSNICPSFAESKSNRHTSRLCVTHREFRSWLCKGAIDESELAKGHIVLRSDSLDKLVQCKQTWYSPSFPAPPVTWILEQFDVFNVCWEGASPEEPKPPMSVRFSYVNSVFEKMLRENHEESTKCKWNLEQWLDYLLQFFWTWREVRNLHGWGSLHCALVVSTAYERETAKKECRKQTFEIPRREERMQKRASVRLLMPLRGFRQNRKLWAAWKTPKKTNAWNLAFKRLKLKVTVFFLGIKTIYTKSCSERSKRQMVLLTAISFVTFSSQWWHNVDKFGPMCRPFVAMMEYESACFLFSSFDFGILKKHIYCDLSAFFIVSHFSLQTSKLYKTYGSLLN